MQSLVAYNTNDTIRNISSSGGVFYAIAEALLNEGGVVCAAAYNSTFGVDHIFIDKLEDLHKLLGSKYVQSDLSNCFRKIKEYLAEGKKVLFAGTPCQVEAIKNFVGKASSFIAIDVVCHGVPSPQVWKSYLTGFSGKQSIISVNFRHKKWGWRNFHLQLQLSNGKKIGVRRSRDPYMQPFLRDYTLRPSCYYCTAKGIERSADITLADAWGAEYFASELDDNLGLTWIIVRTDIGIYLLDKAKYLKVKNINSDKLLLHNRFMNISAPLPDKRINFWVDLHSYDTINLILKKYSKTTVGGYIKNMKDRIKIGTRIRAVIQRLYH